MYGSTTTSTANYFDSSSTTTSMLVLDNVMRRPATLSHGCTGSTSTTVRCCNIVARPHQLIIDYFIDLSRLVSTNKLVENGFHVTRPHGLYVNLVVRSEYSSPGHSGSTSITPYAAATSSSGCTTTSTSFNQKTSRGRLPRHQQLVGFTSNWPTSAPTVAAPSSTATASSTLVHESS
jgi:hypothetical protein